MSLRSCVGVSHLGVPDDVQILHGRPPHLSRGSLQRRERPRGVTVGRGEQLVKSLRLQTVRQPVDALGSRHDTPLRPLLPRGFLKVIC